MTLCIFKVAYLIERLTCLICDPAGRSVVDAIGLVLEEARVIDSAQLQVIGVILRLFIFVQDDLWIIWKELVICCFLWILII